MQVRGARRSSGPEPIPEPLRAAFRDLHGQRLHGFALLLTLGDRATAARLASDALAAGSANMAELRHPERAAAWLRLRVTRRLPRHRPGAAKDAERRLALQELGVGRAVAAGLLALDPRSRAALIATSIERLDIRDVATIVERDGTALDRLIRRARARYAAAAVRQLEGDYAPDGPTVARVRAVAARVLA